MIARENAASITLRGPAGDVEIKKDDITNRENTRRSLMPEGFESLGSEALARHPHVPRGESSTGSSCGPLTRRGRRKAARAMHHYLQSKPARVGRGQNEGARHRRRQFARLRQVLRRDGCCDADGSRIQRELHGRQGPGGGEIGKADVAVISVNRQFFDTPAYRKALLDFAAAGKGLVMLHPGTWYGYTRGRS